MAEIITREEYSLPGDMEEINPENFWNFLDWEKGSKRVTSKIRNPFEQALCEETGYSDTHRPPGEVESIVEVGDIEFTVKTKPTTKTPSYREVVDRFREYLGFLQEEKVEEDVLRRGVRRLDGELYLSLDLLEEKLTRDQEEALTGKEGVEQRVILPNGEVPELLVVSFDFDYGTLTQENAVQYGTATTFLKEWNSLAKKFKEAVKEDSLALLGRVPTQPVAIRYGFNGTVFYHHLEPRKRVAYREVVGEFVKPFTPKPRKGSKVGDFPKLRRHAEGQEDFLREKELIDDRFLETYRPRTRDGNLYVRHQGVSERLETYSTGKPFLEQNFSVRRV